MGCDIHFYVERRVDGQWVTADRWTKDEYDEGEMRLRVARKNRLYTGRNYNLFAILADVRNGHGFAGVKTGEGFVPMAKPRGLPTDVCQQIREESDAYGSDGHSHSWFTVAEIMAYDWTQVSCLQGWVNGGEFYRWNCYRRERGFGPEEYCGNVDGPGVEHISMEEMDKRIKELLKDVPVGAIGLQREALKPVASTYCLVEWTEPYYRAGQTFLGECLPRLWCLGVPEDVRIVFWFDN